MEMGLSAGFDVVAHRGAMGYAPENTLASFRKAIALGATMIELDVHLTKDHEVVVIHDSDLVRTTTGRIGGRDDLTEIQSFDAGLPWDPSFEGRRCLPFRK